MLINILIDSQEYIIGLAKEESLKAKLLSHIDKFNVFIPFIVEREVVRNLSYISFHLPHKFYQLIKKHKTIQVEFELPPTYLIKKYNNMGLKKADSAIAAFAEWKKVDYFISDNRHFLQKLETKSFKIVTAEEFLKKLKLV